MEICAAYIFATNSGGTRISALAVLKGVLILQKKFAVVGESEPIVIARSGLCGSTPTVGFR
jgi:hypothetical protein